MPTTRLMTGGAGTPRYMAPEVAAMSDTYGFPADVYSFTILLWQIVTSRTPYADILSPTELACEGSVREQAAEPRSNRLFGLAQDLNGIRLVCRSYETSNFCGHLRRTGEDC
jgi:serine/threonine protein kinase